MPTAAAEQTVQTLEIIKDEQIAAPPEIVFETILEQLGPASEMPGGEPFPMKFEAWPGGRWYRDLGGKSGHLWGHVQVIKPPRLLEISGPLFMSYPAISHVQYRITAEGNGARLTFTHKAMGLIIAEHAEGVQEGWNYGIQKIRESAEQKAAQRH